MNQKGPARRAPTKSPAQAAVSLQTKLKKAPVTKVRTDEADTEEKDKLSDIQLLEIREKGVKIDRLEQDNEGRKTLRDAVFTVTVLWLFFVLLLFYNAGAGKLHYSDSVLIALLTTTTANVAGFLYAVLNYLYNKDKTP